MMTATPASSTDPHAAATDAMTGDDLVRCERDARGVVRLTLNRPQAFNALSEALLDALQTRLDALAADDGVRVVVIAAEGRAFCAGHDLREMRAEPSQAYYERLCDRSGFKAHGCNGMP